MRYTETYDGSSEGRLTQAETACSRRRQIEPARRRPVTHRDDLEPGAGLGIAATMGGSKTRGHQKGQRKETGGVTICTMPVVTAIPIQNGACTSA